MPERAAGPRPAPGYWEHTWYEESAPPAWLRALSGIYGAMVRARRVAYARGLLRRQRLDVPVVIVGNLTVGGTGKTPLVVRLARNLRAAGLTPGIVTRGYGRKAQGLVLVDERSTPAEVGDEALLLRRRGGCDVAVSADRVAAGRALVARGCHIVVSDDGLQHLRLERDYEIAVVDGQRGLGNGFLLPAGPLREGAERLGSVDLVVFNEVGGIVGKSRASVPSPGQRTAMRLVGERAWPVVEGAGFASCPLSDFRDQRVHAVAGIGNPRRFFDSLRAAGIQPVEHAFPDHHGYAPADLAFAEQLPVLMTEKDAVKCRAFAARHHWYVPVEAVLPPDAEQRLMAQLIQLAHVRGGSQP